MTTNVKLWDDFGVHRPFHQMLDRGGIDLAPVGAECVTRKSDENDQLAMEQAGKALGVIAKTEVDLRELLDRWPVTTWLSQDGRRELGVVDVRVCDVMPWRMEDDPNGTTVIGQLLVHRSVACLVVANSGFTYAYDDEMAPRNPYAMAVEQLMKAVRQAAGMEAELRLRLARDTTRKGRLALALGRMDHFRSQLEFQLWYGSEQMSEGAWAQLLEDLKNRQNEEQRTGTVTNLLSGRLTAISQGALPAAEVNLPPTLCHRSDPASHAIDPRIRTSGGALETFHAHEIQPALREYLTAFARGAAQPELAVILRKHQVPTATPGKSQNTYSRQRTSTFDQLAFADAERRAERWLTQQDHKMRPVPADGDPDVELTNELALRKIGLVANGAASVKWTNPTPGVTSYDAGHHGETLEVVRKSHFDTGRVETAIHVGFPEQHHTRTETRWVDGTGAPCTPGAEGAEQVQVEVVTDQVVVDDAEQPVTWKHWGVDPVVLWLAAERVWKTHTHVGAIHRDSHARRDHKARLLGRIDGWRYGENDDGERVRTRQWKLLPRGSSQSDVERVNRYRWMIWRDAADAVTDDGVERGWTEITDGLANRVHRTGTVKNVDRDTVKENPWHQHHLATFNEAMMLRDLVRAMKQAVRDHLVGDLALQTPSSAHRDAQVATRTAALRAQIDALAGQIADAERNAELQDAAVGFHASRGSDDKADAADRKADEHRTDAAGLQAEKAQLEAELAGVDHDDEDLATGPDTFATVAELIAFIEASLQGDWASRRGPGDVPADLAAPIAKMFIDWDVSEPATDASGSSNSTWSCTWVLTMADATVRTLPLCGRWHNTKGGLGAKDTTDTEVARDVLLGRCTIDEAIDGLTRDISPEALWKNRVRPTLSVWGVHNRLRAAAYDNPCLTTRQILAVRLGGAPEPDGAGWSKGLADHIVATYDGTLRSTWQDAAVPGDITDMHAIIAALGRTADHRQHGIALKDLEGHQPGWARLACHMIAPPGLKKPNQPQMLEWRDRGVVGLIPCPHDQCEGTGAYADLLLYLPETTPGTDGSIGGVLCRKCRRLPRTDRFGDFQFTPDYLTLTRYTGSNYRANGVHLWDGLSRQLPSLTVPHLPAYAKRTLAVIARSQGLSRYRTQKLLADIPTHQERTAPGGSVLTLYALNDVREATESLLAKDTAA